jgi:hypothetical protein
MAICGFCKRGDLKKIQLSGVVKGNPVVLRETALESHTIPTTSKTICKGMESYMNLDSTGIPSSA